LKLDNISTRFRFVVFISLVAKQQYRYCADNMYVVVVVVVVVVIVMVVVVW